MCKMKFFLVYVVVCLGGGGFPVLPVREIVEMSCASQLYIKHPTKCCKAAICKRLCISRFQKKTYLYEVADSDCKTPVNL